jgi:hypothetical protein
MPDGEYSDQCVEQQRKALVGMAWPGHWPPRLEEFAVAVYSYRSIGPKRLRCGKGKEAGGLLDWLEIPF